MPLNKVHLEKIRNNDSTLTSLDLYRNQIGAAGAKDLSEALKHNTTLFASFRNSITISVPTLS
jgi:hypothetical protein